jgi:hypothetical protein
MSLVLPLNYRSAESAEWLENAELILKVARRKVIDPGAEPILYSPGPVIQTLRVLKTLRV